MMHKGTRMTRGPEEEKEPLNNQKSDTPNMNRGFELLIRNKKRREPPKTFQFKFGKMVSCFSREIHFFLDVQFDIRKKEG